MFLSKADFLSSKRTWVVRLVASVLIFGAIAFSSIFFAYADTLSPPQDVGTELLCDPAVVIFWTAPNAKVQSYKIKNVGVWPPRRTTNTGYTDTAVSKDTYYIYDIIAVYSEGESAPSSILVKTPSEEDCEALDTQDITHYCPYTTDVANNKFAINFVGGFIYRSKQEGVNASVSMPAGRYRARLVGLDGYPERINKYQPNEQYYVSFKNSSGVKIARTSNTTDLKDYVVYDYKNEVVDGSLTISDCVSSAQALWGGGWNMKYAGSLSPVCGYFEKLDGAGNSCQLNNNNNNQNNKPPVSITSFTAAPSTISRGSSSNLQWTTVGAVSCDASNGWSGSKSVNGSQSTGPLINTTAYTLRCKDSNGNTDTKGVTLTVNQFETITSVNCQASPQIANIGQDITWTVAPVPASGSYTYSWSGDDNLSGSSQIVTKSYSTTGTKTGIVDIGGATNPQQCTGTVRVTASPSFDEF